MRKRVRHPIAIACRVHSSINTRYASTPQRASCGFVPLRLSSLVSRADQSHKSGGALWVWVLQYRCLKNRHILSFSVPASTIRVSRFVCAALQSLSGGWSRAPRCLPGSIVQTGWFSQLLEVFQTHAIHGFDGTPGPHRVNRQRTCQTVGAARFSPSPMAHGKIERQISCIERRCITMGSLNDLSLRGYPDRSRPKH